MTWTIFRDIMNKNPTKTNCVDEFIHNNARVNDPKLVNNCKQFQPVFYQCGA